MTNAHLGQGTPAPPILSRRRFLKTTSLAMAGRVAAGTGKPSLVFAAPAVKVVSSLFGKPRPRPDLLDKDCPKGLEVFQLTTEAEVPGAHLYMEAQIFTLDSKRLVLHRSAHAHGSSKDDPKHQYLLCDLENAGALAPLTHERGATGASVSPNGKHVYYFVDETRLGGGRLTLKQVNLDGSDRQTILVIDTPLPGTKFRPSHIYPLSTISSDGQRLAISAFLGDGRAKGAPYGLMVFELTKAKVRLVLHGPTWCNVHPQYCRALDPPDRGCP